MKVGDVIWFRYENGGRIFSKQEIVAETSRSWIVLNPDALGWQRSSPMRYGKKLAKSGKGWELGTDADAALAQWAEKHRWRIGNLAQCAKPNILIQVAKLIEYPELPPC